MPYARWHGNAVIFEDDNTRDHHARVVQVRLQFRRIATLPWPAKSPDLSPVEHLWDILGRRVWRRSHKPQDINELAEPHQKEWHRIPKATNGWLIRSIRLRCFAWLAANGGPTGCSDFCEIDILTLTKLEVKFKSCGSLKKLCY